MSYQAHANLPAGTDSSSGDPRGPEATANSPWCWCITCGSLSMEELLERGPCSPCQHAADTCSTCYKHGLLCSPVSATPPRGRLKLTGLEPRGGSDIQTLLHRVAAAFEEYTNQLGAGAGESDMAVLAVRNDFYAAQVELSQHADSRMNHEQMELQARAKFYDLVEKFLRGRTRGYAPILRSMAKVRHEVPLRPSLSWTSLAQSELNYLAVAAQQRGSFLKVPCAACADRQGPMAECCVIIWNGRVWGGLRGACVNCYSRRRHAACEVARMGEVKALCQPAETTRGFDETHAAEPARLAQAKRAAQAVPTPPATPLGRKRPSPSLEAATVSSKRLQVSMEGLQEEAEALSLAADAIVDLAAQELTRAATSLASD